MSNTRLLNEKETNIVNLIKQGINLSSSYRDNLGGLKAFDEAITLINKDYDNNYNFEDIAEKILSYFPSQTFFKTIKTKDEILAALLVKRGQANHALKNYHIAISDFTKATEHKINEEKTQFLLGCIDVLNWKTKNDFSYLESAKRHYDQAFAQSKHSHNLMVNEELDNLPLGTQESEWFFDFSLMVIDSCDQIQRDRFSRHLIRRANHFLTSDPIKIDQALADYRKAYELNKSVFYENQNLLAPSGYVFNHIVTILNKADLDNQSKEKVNIYLKELVTVNANLAAHSSSSGSRYAAHIISYDTLEKDKTFPANYFTYDFCSQLPPKQQIPFINTLVARTNYFLKEMENNPVYINEVFKGYKKALELNSALNTEEFIFRNHSLEPFRSSLIHFCDKVFSNDTYSPDSEEFKLVFDITRQHSEFKFYFKNYFLRQCDNFLNRCENIKDKKIISNNIIKALYCFKQEAMIGINQHSYVDPISIISKITKYVNEIQIDPDSEEGKTLYRLMDEQLGFIQEQGLILRCKTYLGEWDRTKDINSLIGAISSYKQLLEKYPDNVKKDLNIHEAILLALFTCKGEAREELDRCGILDRININEKMIIKSICKLQPIEFAKLLRESNEPVDYLSTYFLFSFLKNNITLENLLNKFQPDKVSELLNVDKEIWGKSYYLDVLIYIYLTHPTLLCNSPKIMDILLGDETIEQSKKHNLHGFLDKLDQETLINAMTNSPDKIAQLVKLCASNKSYLRQKDQIKIIDAIFNQLPKNLLADVLDKVSEEDISKCLVLHANVQPGNLIIDCMNSNTLLGKRLMVTAYKNVYATLTNINSILDDPNLKGNLSKEDLDGYQETLLNIVPTIAAMEAIQQKINSINKANFLTESQWWVIEREKLMNTDTKIAKQQSELVKSKLANEQPVSQNDIVVILTDKTTSENWKNAFAKACKDSDATYFIKNSQNFLTKYENNGNFDDVIKALYFFDQAMDKMEKDERINYSYIIGEIGSYIGHKVPPNSQEGLLFFSASQKVSKPNALMTRGQTFINNFEKNERHFQATKDIDSLVAALNSLNEAVSNYNDLLGIDKTYETDKFLKTTLVNAKVMLFNDVLSLSRENLEILLTKVANDDPIAQSLKVILNKLQGTELETELEKILTATPIGLLGKNYLNEDFRLLILIYGHSILGKKDSLENYRKTLIQTQENKIIECIKYLEKIDNGLTKNLEIQYKNPMSYPLGERLLSAIANPDVKKFLEARGIRPKSPIISFSFLEKKKTNPIIIEVHNLDDQKKKKEEGWLSNFFKKTEEKPVTKSNEQAKNQGVKPEEKSKNSKQMGNKPF